MTSLRHLLIWSVDRKKAEREKLTSQLAQHISRKRTPQSDPIPGANQVQNNAGGYVYAVDQWARLTRFLVLGTDGGTYYVSERALTRDNAAVVEACLAADPERTVREIVAVSDAGRAPKNDAAILALALAAANPEWRHRRLAYDALPQVCRIPTHLFRFLTYCRELRGWSRGLRSAVTRWYLRWTPEQLAYEVVKYQARDGWRHRDVWRLAHPQLEEDRQAILRWALGVGSDARLVARPKGSPLAARPYRATGPLPPILAAYDQAQTAKPADVARLVREHGLTREMVPTAALTDREVWAALLEHMPLTAMVRNLGKMSAVGLVTPLSAAAQTVVQRLRETEQLRRARIHPMAILNALRVYQQGHGEKGQLTWKPVTAVVDALDAAFYAAFGAVDPTGQRLLLALDVSGSMGSKIAGTSLTCREAAAVMALATANVEPNWQIVGFTAGGNRRSITGAIEPLAISPRQRLDDVVWYLKGLDFGATDCALPMLYARDRQMDVDAFCIYTDSETWAGAIHPSQALRSYRQARGIPAKQVVVGMTATGFTIADPRDPGTLDVVGFDLATPAAISAFLAG